MSNFQDNPSVGNPNNKIDGENETPFKWAYEMDKTQFKYRCPCKKGYHAHGNGVAPKIGLGRTVGSGAIVEPLPCGASQSSRWQFYAVGLELPWRSVSCRPAGQVSSLGLDIMHRLMP